MNSYLEIYRRKIQKRLSGNITLSPQMAPRGRVLFSYFLDPFLLLPHQPFSTRHANYWEAHAIADLFLEKGYVVDVIDARNSTWLPSAHKKYDYFFDTQSNIERLKPLLGENCVIIHHILTSHWKFNNEAEAARLADLQKRTGALLASRRHLPPSKNVELADHVSGLGNDFTFNTYTPATKPICAIPGSVVSTYPTISPEQKDWAVAKKKFLWLGGGGAVHKGLDRVLEVFRDTPELTLYVCGPVEAEVDFATLYKKELHETANIHFMGRVDVTEEEFTRILSECAFLIHPSCAEGQSGAVLTAMHGGLIPIVSRESGVTVDGFGHTLATSTISEIREVVGSLSGVESVEVARRAVASQLHAKMHYTREAFSKAYRSFIEQCTTL